MGVVIISVKYAMSYACRIQRRISDNCKQIEKLDRFSVYEANNEIHFNKDFLVKQSLKEIKVANGNICYYSASEKKVKETPIR